MPRFQDLTGRRFGRWLVVRLQPKEKGKDRKYLCRCECGTEKVVAAQNLRNGKSSSCGCYFREVMATRIEDLVGQRFGRLRVLAQSSERKSGRVAWVCICDCGKEKIVTGHDLVGSVRSCGCLHSETASQMARRCNTTHGMTLTPTYRSWQSMIARCTASKSPDYKDYGAAGITVCDRWLNSFEAFLEDMGERPKGKTLDRVDNRSGYHPGNCRWATPKQQARNRRNNRSLTCQGETLLLAEWVERTGIPKSTILNRLYRGKTVEQALGFAEQESSGRPAP